MKFTNRYAYYKLYISTYIQRQFISNYFLLKRKRRQLCSQRLWFEPDLLLGRNITIPACVSLGISFVIVFHLTLNPIPAMNDTCNLPPETLHDDSLLFYKRVVPRNSEKTLFWLKDDFSLLTF